MKNFKLGVVGLGHRGLNMIQTFLAVKGVEVVAVCDAYEERVEKAKSDVKDKKGYEPVGYTDFKKFLKHKTLDAVYVASSWEAHINQTIDCIKHHIPVGMEVGGAYSTTDCFRLVNAYEKYKTPMMLMENCCYDKFELLTTKLAREGFFGEIVHAHGAYSHDLREEIATGNIKKHYRLRNYISRNCENYPTHELGPIAKILNINRGNKFVSIVSVASKARGLHEYCNSDKCEDKTLKDVVFNQGDIISTIITCENGETITLSLDTTLPKYYSREFTIRGTKGLANEEANMIFLDDKKVEYWQPEKTIESNLNNAENYKDYLPKYWKEITQEQIELGHGGMDFLMVEEFVKAVKEKRPMPIDVYDAASWYVITALSAKSIANGGRSYKIPDFTKGKYKERKPEDVLDF